MGGAEYVGQTLTLKQRQFNAAMAKYTSNPAYKAFGYGVAIANIALQLFLLTRVSAIAIGLGERLPAIVAAWLFADFLNGLIHMYMDNNDRYTSLAGPLIANFHLHHKTPQYRKNALPIVYFLESGSKVWLIGYQLAVVFLLTAVPLKPLLAHALVYAGILSSVAEVSHYLCHSSTAKSARLLASCGLLLDKRHHARHHLENNCNYAFLNGWSDPLLNFIARLFYPGYKSTTDLHFANYDNGTTDSR